MPFRAFSLPLAVVRVAAGIAIAALAFGVPAFAVDAADRIGVPGPISFDGTDYALAWSSNPSPGYFKQEYVPEGQTVESYTRMVLVEVAAGVDVMGALAAQVDMLNRRKGTDPLVNMDIVRNDRTGEVLLDFIVSDKDAQGEYIAEWNAYRYAPHAGGSVLLFAVSHRAYGNDDVRAFLGNLRAVRPDQIDKIAQQALPNPTLPQ